jgi:hypothetical protein
VVSGVYLEHLESPVHPDRPARHYLGGSKDIAARHELHKSGQGSKMLKAAAERGIGFEIVRVCECEPGQVWPLEQKLKRQRNHWKYCPICSGKGERDAVRV